MTGDTLLERATRSEHAGENRCIPCTVLNLAITAVVAVVVGVAVPIAGIVLFVVAVAAIWLRGSLVPGTPRLTKCSLPDRMPERFETSSESTPTSTAELEIDQYLREIGVVLEDPVVDDLVLEPTFERAWRRECAAVDGRNADRDGLAELVGIPPSELEIRRHGTAFVAVVDGERIGQWESRSAFVADVASARVLEDRVESWNELPLGRRSEALGALRLFLEWCPTCGGTVSFEQAILEACCHRYDVLAATCGECDDRVLEIGV
ncbi:hypothetical protein [Natronococcus sp.]|uniref:hypothetical protein n=1 Tax=Natronococcus sp. TaxID=35747 RepID=UPI0025E50F03|nr:hypothetical protein [Natronococcus sp.]